MVEVKFLDLCTSPGCFSQEREARFDAWVVSETPNRNRLSHFRPTDLCNELLKNHRERNALHWILGKFLGHVSQFKNVMMLRDGPPDEDDRRSPR